MSDQIAEVSGRVARRPRRKPGVKAAKRAKNITLVFASKRRRSGKTWDEDWPEFLERLKALMKRFKLTIKKVG